MENLDQVCLSYVEPIMTISASLGLVDTINKINEVSKTMDIPFPQIIASTEYEDGKSRVMFTGHKDWIAAFTKKLGSHDLKSVGEIQQGLYISGYGIVSSNFEAEVFERLGTAKLPILKYIRDSKGLLLVFLERDKSIVVGFADKLLSLP